MCSKETAVSRRNSATILPIHDTNKFPHRTFSEDLSILGPPAQVPNNLLEAPSISRSVKFVEMPEDCNVIQGRALRLYCEVYANSPVG